MTLVEINGIDEAGRVGNNIIFVKVGVQIPSEIRLLIHNLQHFDKLLVTDEEIRGHEINSIKKYRQKILEDESFSVRAYLLRKDSQLILLRELLRNEVGFLYKERGELLQLLDSYEQSKLSGIIDEFDSYKQSNIYVESFVKSYGVEYIAERLHNSSTLYRVATTKGKLFVIQVDGGYPFVFWWKDLLQSDGFKNGMGANGNVFFSGITNGDNHYPTLSTAGVIAHSLAREPPVIGAIHFEEIELKDEFILPENFYVKHKQSLSKPTFQQRMIFLGAMAKEVRSLLPYAFHYKERNKTYEPFRAYPKINNSA